MDGTDKKTEKPVVFLNRKRKIGETPGEVVQSQSKSQQSLKSSPKSTSQKTKSTSPKNPPFQTPQTQTSAIDNIPEIDRQTITKMLHNMIGQDDDNAVLAPREINLFPQSGIAKAKAEQFWGDQLEAIQSLNSSQIFKPSIPLARIKKIMKMDENVKMISGEVPHLFAKAAEIFITELTLKSWIHTEDSKRRTLQRNDVAYAIAQSDMFDFLIDIVPREEFTSQKLRQDDLDKLNEEHRLNHVNETNAESEKSSKSSKVSVTPNPSENQLTYELAGQLTENGQKSVVVEINGKKYRLEADK